MPPPTFPKVLYVPITLMCRELRAQAPDTQRVTFVPGKSSIDFRLLAPLRVSCCDARALGRLAVFFFVLRALVVRRGRVLQSDWRNSYYNE